MYFSDIATGGATYVERFQYILDDLITGEFNLSNFQTFLDTYSKHSTNLDTKFANVLYLLENNYYNGCIDFVDVDLVPGETATKPAISDDKKKRFASRFVAIYTQSQDKYLELLTLYAAEKSHLMDQINAVQTSNATITNRTNDTPQNGGAWEDDRHTSNYQNSTNDNTVTTNSDPGTIMSRLAEVQEKYANLEGDWADEFKGLFCPEE